MHPTTRERAKWPEVPGRRPLLAVAARSAMIAALTRPLAALAANAPTFGCRGVLEKERSAAESYAVMLATVGRKDIDRYVRGIRHYGTAKWSSTG